MLFATIVVVSALAVAARAATFVNTDSAYARATEWNVVLRADKVNAAAHAELAAQLKGTVTAIGDTFKMVSVSGVERAALDAQLAAFDGAVRYVEPNMDVHALDVFDARTERACADQRQPVSWGQVRVSGGADPNEDDHFIHDPAAGQGTVAFIIDTGIQISHNDFGGRASWGTNTIDSDDTDGNGHGTHVASTTGGSVWGVAKGIDELIAVKVLSASGGGTVNSVVGGIKYSAENCPSGKKCTANMSLGGGKSSALNDAVNAAVAAGTAQIVAGGNSNADSCNYSPASATEAITAGSTDLGNSGGKQVDIRSFFSNYGSCTQIFAPGSDITAAWIGADDATRTISGTSMASPHVCGIANTLLGQGVEQSKLLDALQSAAHEDVIDLNCSNSACNSSPNLLLHQSCE